MADDGETKDDVKVPDGEVGEKIEKLFTTEEKDTSKFATRNSNFIFISKLTFLFSDVIVLSAMGEQLAVEAKEAPRG